jgi:peptidyl-prolyl cis-trans isomerase D
MLIGKWYDLLRSTIVVDPAAVEEEFRRRNEKVTFRYIALPTEALADEIEIADADLQAWYEAHRDRYTGGEGRRAIYVLIDEDAVAERVDISDEEVESYYEESRQVFERPERRELRQILLSVAPDASPDQVEAARQRAAELAARARGGEEFAALATQASDDEASRERGGQIGTFTRTQMEPAMAERVFALEEGAVSDPIRSDTGFHVVKVEDVLEAGVQPLEEVADQIRGQLRFRQSRDIGAEVAEELRERAAETGNLRAAAEEMELDPRDTGVVTRSGTVPGLGPVPQMIETMFELEPGEVSEVLSLPRGEAVLVVQETVPRYLPPLDTQRQQVEADFRRDRAGEQASERIEQALERAGGDLEAAARRLGAEVRETEPPFLRNQPLPEVGTSIALERAAFTTPVGEMVGPVRTDEAVVALEVVERQEPDPEQLEAERAQLLEALRQPRFQRLLQEKTQQLLERAEIDYNPEVQPAPAEG